ncbi:hypothetical protein [Cellvibrio sp. NN19]|uniref:hypothetical protein n=1 Tax=Cellvibrio chitinivorans TaxID=3102792 RepID=UPI002B402747|nr:hypothetical protein [Cellvibrio sp. NN19]
MIISNAQIGMAAQRDYREELHVTEQLEFWRDQPVMLEPTRAEVILPPEPEVDLSQAGSLLAMYRISETLDLTGSMDSRTRLNKIIIESMYKAITGAELRVTSVGDLRAKQGSKVESLSVDTAPPSSAVAQAAAQLTVVRSAGPGLIYQRHERYQEQESMRFQAVGVVHTADGREIDFSVAMKMSREFVQESNLQIEAGSKKVDPLVINFDGLGAALSQTRFEFDLDSDGTAEQIASLRPGSGYLALDRNGDGSINNGSELFGPSSGRGFAELAAYDEDGNNFIDEGDSIYHQLRIWSMNEDGSTQLMALGDKNIGAIFLGHVTSSFQLKDEQNNSLGEVVNSGVYLTEDGKVGVVQEINLTV